jgi:hypothetical protein
MRTKEPRKEIKKKGRKRVEPGALLASIIGKSTTYYADSLRGDLKKKEYGCVL